MDTPTQERAAEVQAAQDRAMPEAGGELPSDRVAQLAVIHDDITRRFCSYDVGAHEWTLKRVREEVRDLAHTLGILVPPGRELSLVLTKLEEAMFFANAGIARSKGVPS